jgi:hypothetical protein
MNKSAIVAIALTLLVAFSFLGVAFGDESVAVKKGDWIEYQVTVTGNPTPDLNITWAQMNITGVEGPAINVSVQTLFGNGTLFPEPYVPLNVATGAIGDGFFIPTTIVPGDIYLSTYEGNITITSTEQVMAGGIMRNAFVGVTNETTYYWDEQTGIMISAISNLPGCTMYTRTTATSLWQPLTQIYGLSPTFFYALVVVAMGAVVAIVVIAVWKKDAPRKTTPPISV